MQLINNIRQKIQEHQTLSLILLGLFFVAIVSLPFILKSSSTEEINTNHTPTTKYDPISHESYYTDGGLIGDFEDDSEVSIEPQILGFKAISTTTRGDLFEQFLQNLNEYTKKTFTDEEIIYISLQEDSLTYNNKSADYFAMNFTIYFNGSHPTKVTFQTYPKVSTKFTPVKES